MTTSRQGWFARLAAATGFPSSLSMALRCLLGVGVLTLIERFVLYPPAALAFDIAIAVAALVIVLLLAFFTVRARSG